MPPCRLGIFLFFLHLMNTGKTTPAAFSAKLSPKNYEQKCLCLLLLDLSGSMHGEKLARLKEGLYAFVADVAADFTASQRLEVAVVGFNTTAFGIVPPGLIADLDIKAIDALTAGGSTSMYEALEVGMSAIEAHKNYYKKTGQPYYRPYLVLMTDGEATDRYNAPACIERLQREVSEKRFTFLPVGVDGADMDELNRLGPARKLQDVRFAEFFKWLSASMSMISQSVAGQTIKLPSTDPWAEQSI